MPPSPDRRPPAWSKVWREARRQHRDPVDALVDAGLCDPIPPRADPPVRAGPGPHRRSGPLAEPPAIGAERVEAPVSRG